MSQDNTAEKFDAEQETAISEEERAHLKKILEKFMELGVGAVYGDEDDQEESVVFLNLLTFDNFLDTDCACSSAAPLIPVLFLFGGTLPHKAEAFGLRQFHIPVYQKEAL